MCCGASHRNRPAPAARNPPPAAAAAALGFAVKNAPQPPSPEGHHTPHGEAQHHHEHEDGHHEHEGGHEHDDGHEHGHGRGQHGHGHGHGHEADEPHHGKVHHGGEGKWDEAAELERLEERRAEGRRRVLYRRCGVGVVYVTWGVMAWVIFTYGKLIYDLIGPAEEAAFAREWGVAVGLDNAAQWQDVIQEAVSSTLKLLVLQRLRLIPAEKWLEESLDALSVQATLLDVAMRGRWARVRAHLRFNARVEG